jgi:RimJ/RimL family protein N-acetyltransferase
LTDRELLRRHLAACWSLTVPPFDDEAHEIELPAEAAPPWALYLARIADAEVAIWRAGVPAEQRAELRDRARRAGARWEPVLAIRREVAHAEPTIAPERLAAAERLARTLDAADAPLLEAFEAESAAYYLNPRVAPCIGVVVDGELLSVAHSSRQTSVACELGIDTLPEARRRGYAAAATILWTALIQRRGLTPIYSAFAWNDASLRLAQSVGYLPRIAGAYGPVPAPEKLGGLNRARRWHTPPQDPPARVRVPHPRRRMLWVARPFRRGFNRPARLVRRTLQAHGTMEAPM